MTAVNSNKLSSIVGESSNGQVAINTSSTSVTQNNSSNEIVVTQESRQILATSTQTDLQVNSEGDSVVVGNLQGAGFSGGSYNQETGVVSFLSDDGLEFSTSDLRGTNANLSNEWIYLVTGYASEPTFTQTISDGDVYTYIFKNGTLFRLVPSGSAVDAFYSTFSSGVLSDLVASKGVSI